MFQPYVSYVRQMENTVLPPTAPPKTTRSSATQSSPSGRGASLGSGTYTGRSVWLGKPSAPGRAIPDQIIHPNELNRGGGYVVNHGEPNPSWNHPQLGDD